MNESSEPPAGPDALARWREKLAFLMEKEAIAADAAQQFAIGQQIKEAEQKIRDLTPPESASARSDPAGGRSDAQPQSLSDALDAARDEYERLADDGADTEEVQARILGLKRQIREGGRLRIGDDLLHGRYKLIRMLGHGGFATIFEAREKRFKRAVAIKVLHGQYGDDKSRVERFFRGARKMAELDHQGIVKVFDSDLADEGHHFFVMECLPGGDLRQCVLSGAIDPERALDLILSVGAALAFAHGRGIIHRDIKPANIVLDAVGAPKLTDFDLVRAGDTTGGTRTGMLGTVIYAAPEMYTRPQDADACADVYGLGMTALFALSGADPPWPEILFNPRGVIDRLPVGAALKPVLSRAIASEAAERYPSVESFCAALAQARLAGEPRTVVVKPDPEPVAPTDSGLPQAPAVPSEPPGPIPNLRDPLRDGSPGPAMVWLPGGTFTMGQDDSPQAAERPAHPVRLRAFSIGQYPVTFAEYDRFCSATKRKRPADQGWGRDQRPAINVNWDDAQAYCAWLSRETGERYRLATEAEWEYACRAGGQTRWAQGDEEARLGDYAWYSKNAGRKTHPVGEKHPNAWHLYDMHGNVWEWCEDWYSGSYYQQLASELQQQRSPATAARSQSTGTRAASAAVDASSLQQPASENPSGPASGSRRVARGGAWYYEAVCCRSAYRDGRRPSHRDGDLGFRLSRTGPWPSYPITLVGTQPPQVP